MADRTCSVDGCQRPVYCKGLCSMHYDRIRYGLPMDASPMRVPRDGHCSHETCDRTIRAKGLCNMHYQRAVNGKDMDAPPKGVKPESCIHGACPQPVYAKGLCQQHYERQRAGIDMDDPRRPRIDNPGYATIHARLKCDRGKASAHACIDCGGPARDWSYDHADSDERIEILRGCRVAYSTDLDHYQPRCKSCHQRFDRGR